LELVIEIILVIVTRNYPTLVITAANISTTEHLITKYVTL